MMKDNQPNQIDMKYFNEKIGSDSYPYELVNEVSDKTVEIRRMKSTIDPEWKPEFHVGGFAAHCSNQFTQKWIYESDEDAPLIRIRKKKNQPRLQTVWGKGGRIFYESDSPYRFHDYNF